MGRRRETQRSTVGAFGSTPGYISLWYQPVGYISHTCVIHSTLKADVVAGDTTCRGLGIAFANMWSTIVISMIAYVHGTSDAVADRHKLHQPYDGVRRDNESRFE